MEYWLNVDAPNKTQFLHVEDACGDVKRKGTFGVKRAGELNRVGGWLPFGSIQAANADAHTRLTENYKPLAFCSNCQKTVPEFASAAVHGGVTSPSPPPPTAADVLAALRPSRARLVYELVQEANLDVTDWSFDADGNPINPNTNTYRNSQWSFGGEDQPIILCSWWRELEAVGTEIHHRDNPKAFGLQLANALAGPERTPSEAQRLRGKIKKSTDVGARVGEAFRRRKPIRLILLDGEAAGWEVAATTSSQTEFRELDPVEWFVHDYDPFSGEYRLVRGVRAPERKATDPHEGVEDPGEDPALLALLNSLPLSDTEKDALVKLRVGQGYFRDQLLKRWGGCSVSGCKDVSVLVASHIVPWRLCTTRAERLGVGNGLLLTPNLDKLFDRGLISFDVRGKIMRSSKLNLATEQYFGIHPGLQLRQRDVPDVQVFLERHRAEIFQGPAKSSPGP
jgi:hypothetical protein